MILFAELLPAPSPQPASKPHIINTHSSRHSTFFNFRNILMLPPVDLLFNVSALFQVQICTKGLQSVLQGLYVRGVDVKALQDRLESFGAYLHLK